MGQNDRFSYHLNMANLRVLCVLTVLAAVCWEANSFQLGYRQRNNHFGYPNNHFGYHNNHFGYQNNHFGYQNNHFGYHNNHFGYQNKHFGSWQGMHQNNHFG